MPYTPPLPLQEERQALRGSADGYVAAEADRFVNISAAAEPPETHGGPTFGTTALTASFFPAVVPPEPTTLAHEKGIRDTLAESIHPAPQQQPSGPPDDVTRAFLQLDGPGGPAEAAGGTSRMTFLEQVRSSPPSSDANFGALARPPRPAMQARVVFLQTQDPAITCFLAWTFLSSLGAPRRRGLHSPHLPRAEPTCRGVHRRLPIVAVR